MTDDPQSPKSLLFVIGSLDRGGAEIHLSRVLPQLDRTRFNPIVLTTAWKGDLAHQMEQRGTEVIGPWVKSAAGSKWNLKKIFLLTVKMAQLFWHLAIKRPSLVHFFLPSSYWIGGPISLCSRRTIKVMSRRSMNTYQEQSWAPVGRIERWLHGHMDAVLGNSRRVVRQLIVEERSPREKTLLLYSGVNVPTFGLGQREAARQELELEPDVVVMTSIANLRPIKGHEDLVRACARIESQTPWVLLVVGYDMNGLTSHLKALTARFGVPDIILGFDMNGTMSRCSMAGTIMLLSTRQLVRSNP